MKKIDELKQNLETVKGEVRSLNDAGKVEEAEANWQKCVHLNHKLKFKQN
jgi:hypothetical protein